jgi:hypothetical protein
MNPLYDTLGNLGTFPGMRRLPLRRAGILTGTRTTAYWRLNDTTRSLGVVFFCRITFFRMYILLANG